jgi:rRNA maturation protein Nop10
MGKLGGLARAKALTAQERSAAARHAVEARWAKYRAEQRRRGRQEGKRG